MLIITVLLEISLKALSSAEAALLLVSTKNRDLWPGLTPDVRDSRTSRHSAHVQSQIWQIWLVLVSIYCVYKAIQNRNVVRLQNSRFRSFRKARRAVSVILECEAREPHTPAGRVRRESLPHSPSPFLHPLQTFRSNMDAPSLTVARVRKKYDCFAV